MCRVPDPPRAIIDALSPTVVAALREWMEAALAPTPAAPSSPTSAFVNTKEAALILRCEHRPRRVYELVHDGRLTRAGDGRRLLLYREEVERLAAGDPPLTQPERDRMKRRFSR